MTDIFSDTSVTVFATEPNTAETGKPVPSLVLNAFGEISGVRIDGDLVVEAKFDVMCPVQKPKGYPWPGVVIGVCQTLSGQTRYVVERVDPANEEPEGCLHIFAPGQLQYRETSEGFAAEAEEAGATVEMRLSPEDAERVKAFLSAEAPRSRGGSLLQPLTKAEEEIIDEVAKHLQPLTNYVMTGTAERVAVLLAVEPDEVRNVIKKARYRNDPRAGVQRVRKA